MPEWTTPHTTPQKRKKSFHSKFWNDYGMFQPTWPQSQEFFFKKAAENVPSTHHILKSGPAEFEIEWPWHKVI